MNRTETSSGVTLEYFSLAELAEAVEAKAVKSPAYASRKAPERDWDNGLGFTGAVAMARTGGRWEEGTRRMEAAASLIFDAPPAMRKKKRRSVAGSRPNIPAYAAGSPLNMYRRAPQPDHVKRVVRLAVHVGTAWFWDADAVTNRGAAILSAVKRLEADGVQVEVWACWPVKISESASYTFDAQLRIKAASEFFSPEDCAYALSHPGFYRRLFFAALEREAADHDNKKARKMVESHYGTGSGITSRPGFDAFIPYGGRDDYKCATPAGAMDYINELLGAQLTTTRAA